MVISFTILWKDQSGRDCSYSINMGQEFPIPEVGDTLLTPDDGNGSTQHVVKVDQRQFNYQFRGGGDLTVFVYAWCSLPAPPKLSP